VIRSWFDSKEIKMADEIPTSTEKDMPKDGAGVARPDQGGSDQPGQASEGPASGGEGAPGAGGPKGFGTGQ
jgi:hypothetical protein